MYDYSGNGSFGWGDWQITIGGGSQQPPYNGYPGNGYPYPGTPQYPVYVPPLQNNNQLLMLGLVVLALFVISKH